MIKGLRGTSLVDYPGKIAAVVFLGGCNFRCPYCYNVDLVLPERLRRLPDLSEKELLSELRRREGFIRGVVLTGGEPTLWGRRLIDLCARIREAFSLSIKLDTNGSHPGLLAELLSGALVDYVALDFKTAPSRYPELSADFAPVAETLEILKGLNGRAEVRITLAPALVGPKEIEEMLPYLQGLPRLALQKFVGEVELLDPDFPSQPYSREELLSLKEIFRQNLPSTEILTRF
ncbi:anaerobic ribonucleoside-triphosphate reductase activating protein [Thermosulfurimonas marina]|uniref:Anaerobic ribonucleoside-triphosphate reductase activating protein n=1 Tax=Thermosulfurimonas marina TaxID=2047767 RepID=A0A6H1WRA4_9BACT|nr:anaerobic ribonucleoside-triphosphate reductase activating protein [Thermosulfurimonas marina]QJA05690.1 anaerobic ribonucleoside-triphosphate reductase activating protein [Thermosulfurimonas marina]